MSNAKTKWVSFRSARTFLWLAIAATSTVAAPAAIAIHNYTHRHASTWHTTPAPVNTPVTIQADAYFDGHVWRSYDNGTPINAEQIQWKKRD